MVIIIPTPRRIAPEAQLDFQVLVNGNQKNVKIFISIFNMSSFFIVSYFTDFVGFKNYIVLFPLTTNKYLAFMKKYNTKLIFL